MQIYILNLEYINLLYIINIVKGTIPLTIFILKSNHICYINKKYRSQAQKVPCTKPKKET